MPQTFYYLQINQLKFKKNLLEIIQKRVGTFLENVQISYLSLSKKKIINI